MSSLLAVLGWKADLRCRLCLRCPAGDSWSHLDRPLRIARIRATLSLRTILNTLRHTQIYSDINLPQNVCDSCMRAALHSILFWRQCQESEKKWTVLADTLCKSTLSLESEVKNKAIQAEMKQEDIKAMKKPVFILTKDKFKEIIIPKNLENKPKNVQEYITQNLTNTFDDVGLKCYFKDGPDLDLECNLEQAKKKRVKKENLNSTIQKYECSHCSHSFLKKEYLITHLKVKHNIFQKVECNVCKRKFTSICVLRKHVTIHKTPEAYKCSLCHQVFILAKQLEDHITETHHEKKFKCPKCPELFYRESDAQKHQMGVHDSGHEYICKQCGKKYQSLVRLQNHEGKHRSNICHKCGHCFKFPYRLKQHSEKCKQNEIIRCHQCSELFKTRADAKKHCNEVHNTNLKYGCEVCNRAFLTAPRLQRHMTNHTGVVCEKCGHRFKYQSQLKSHTNSCLKKPRPGNPRCVKEPAGPPQFICDCGKEFIYKESLRSHIKSQHLFHKVYKCNHCDRRFSYKGGLNAHLVVHTRERPEQCNICGKYFVTKPALVYHMRLHTGERPFACDMCDERFLSASRRMAHVRTKHWGRTEECTVCSSKFYTPYALRKHMSRHSNPNSTLFCSKIPEDLVQ